MSGSGEIIRQARLRSGLSQAELARRAGTSQAAISRIERGQEQPTLERLEQILAGLGWRPVVSLEPVATHREEPRRLLADRNGDPGIRLEAGLDGIEFAMELFGKAKQSSGA